MLVVKIEFHDARNGQVSVINEMRISNNRSHPQRPKYGNYDVLVDGEKVNVEHHARRLNVWKLVARALGEWQAKKGS